MAAHQPALPPHDDVKERVRDAVDIVDVVGSYISLRRGGKAMVGLCPWHDDSRPSLQVNPERQTFRCWVCDIGGDVFNFLMRMEKDRVPRGARTTRGAGRHRPASGPRRPAGG